MVLVLWFHLVMGYFHGVESIHDFHVSKVDVEYNVKTSAFEITGHIFIDDLEDALRLKGQDSLYLCTKREVENADEFVEAYLNDRMKITLDGVETRYNYLGKEISDDLMALWFYLEIEDAQPVESISVKCSLLMELFDDQTNLVKIQYSNRQKKYFMFQGSDTLGNLDLQ